MAPSRRKGCGKAAAAAACRQWKVGDLVLAKVKGYPAWPATISEPEKWGYSSDAKKVLVYFFGTQQIALCNPIDVEPFTEERKESLLTKRHGKGADFVRALHEIIDSYEQLKKEGDVACNPANNAMRKNSGTSGDHLGPQNRNEASNVALNLCAQTPLVVEDKELKVAAEDSVEIVKESDIFLDKVTITKDPKEKNQGTTYFSRKRFRDSCSSQKKVVTAPRSKFLSRVDVSKFEKCILSPSNDDKAATDVPASLLRDEIRSKKVWKSPNVADKETDLHAMPLNGSSEENGSEILTVDSEAVSLNEGSTMDSDSNLQHPEPVLERCDEIEMNQISVLEEEAVIVRKRRNQSRKRSTGDASDVAKVVEDTGSEVEALRAGQHFPDNRHTPLDKGDGDKHLPLVKRARVRLDRSSSTKEDLVISSPLEDKSSLLLNKVPGNVCTSLTPDLNCIVDTKTFIVKFDASDPVQPNLCSQSSVNQLHVSDGRSTAKMGCPVDGEAALPPSKRLHRALEAMSAKVAENTKSEALFSIKTYINGSISSRESPGISVGGNGGKFSAIESFDLTNANASPGINCTGIISSSELPEAEERANSPREEVNCNKLVNMNSNQNNEFCEVRALENLESDELRSLPFSSLGESINKVVMAKTPKKILPSPGIQEDNLGYDESSLELPSTSKVGGQDGDIDNHHKIEKSQRKPYISHDLEVVSDPGSRDAQFAVKLHVEGGGGSDMMKPSNSPVITKKEDSQMFNVTGDIKHAPIDSDAITSPTTMKGIAATEYLQNLSGSTSISLDHTGERDMSGQGSSSSMTNRLGSIPCESPPSTSVCNDSTIENDKINTGRCVLTSHTQYVKSKDINNRSSMTEASATLIAFESALGSLTRTKETIGRATRIAIDCAKYGNASKVVEIVARNLETEPSLHRRVDLFFLVDSIAQCSRGLKGEVGDTYPSVIQALLQRLLLAAAPPGSSALENRRQCLKVLRLWLERRILPESIIRHHIRELESLCCSSSGNSFTRRPLRTERPFDDPIREMEGMLVDEYGSNSSLKLAGLCMPPMLKDEEEEGSDSDCDNFEAVTPEHEHKSHEDKEIVLPMVEKHTRILEEVDGELEMEDVAPSCDAVTTSIRNAGFGPSNVLHQFEKPAPLPFLPPLPVDMPPSSPPLPISPPPPLPPPPSGTILVPFDSKVYADAHAIGQSIASVNPEVVPFHAAEIREIQMQPSVPDPCVSNGQPVPHLTVQPASGIQEKNETSFHNVAYPMRPPQPAPSNQFSYMHPDHHHQQLQPQREVPHPSHPGAVGGNFCNDFDRRNMGLHEHGGGGNNWRLPGPPPISGMYYPDCSGGGSYATHYPPGPPCDPSAQMPNNHGWGFPQWNTNHLEFIPHRPPAEGPMPVPIRAPCFWQPR